MTVMRPDTDCDGPQVLGATTEPEDWIFIPWRKVAPQPHSRLLAGPLKSDAGVTVRMAWPTVATTEAYLIVYLLSRASQASGCKLEVQLSFEGRGVVTLAVWHSD